VSASRLEAAVAAHDAVDVERALNDAYHDGIDIQYLQALIDLLGAKWHERHEDVARALQGLKAPGAELALEGARRDSLRLSDHRRRSCLRAEVHVGTR